MKKQKIEGKEYKGVHYFEGDRDASVLMAREAGCGTWTLMVTYSNGEFWRYFPSEPMHAYGDEVRKARRFVKGKE